MLWFNIARQMDIALALESEFDLLVDSEVEVELRLFDLILLQIDQDELLSVDLGVDLNLALSVHQSGIGHVDDGSALLDG